MAGNWRGLILPMNSLKGSEISLEVERIDDEPKRTAHARLHSVPLSPEKDEDPDNLRGWLLLWDKLVMPEDTEPLWEQFPTRALQYLQSVEVVSTTPIGFDENVQSAAELQKLHPDIPTGALMRPSASLLAFRRLELAEPGHWSIASEKLHHVRELEDGIVVRESAPENDLIFTESGRALLFKLFDAIPIPSRETPLEDVLDFRSKRKAELMSLRHQLERTYQRILGAGDGHLAIRTEVEALAHSIDDLLRVSKESGIRVKLGGIEARLKWEFEPVGMLSDAAAKLLIGQIGSALATVAGGILPKIELSGGAGLKGGRATSTPYEYVIRMHREFSAS